MTTFSIEIVRITTRPSGHPERQFFIDVDCIMRFQTGNVVFRGTWIECVAMIESMCPGIEMTAEIREGIYHFGIDRELTHIEDPDCPIFYIE